MQSTFLISNRRGMDRAPCDMILLLFLWIVTIQEVLSKYPVWRLGLLGWLVPHTLTLAELVASQRPHPLLR